MTDDASRHAALVDYATRVARSPLVMRGLGRTHWSDWLDADVRTRPPVKPSKWHGYGRG